MNTTLYEILEVSENASTEVIEKAYKVLAKKYHPDLQLPENKHMAEQKMKQINEAYDILSDDSKRRQYDETLKKQRTEENNSNVSVQEPKPQERQVSQEEQRFYEMQKRKYEQQLYKQQKQMQQNMQAQYENIYYDYLRSLGYRIKERWTWEKTKNLILTLLIMAGIFIVLWIFPPTHNLMINIYENNSIIKVIVDIVVGIFEALFQAIATGFKSLFDGW